MIIDFPISQETLLFTLQDQFLQFRLFAFLVHAFDVLAVRNSDK